MSTKYWTIPELIERWGIDKEAVYNGVNKGGWPHLRFGARTVRFSDEHVQEIEAMLTVRAPEKSSKQRRKEMDERLANYARRTA